MENNAYIKAISYYLPDKIYDNLDFLKDFPEMENNANLLKIGVEKRHIVDKNILASDLAVSAGQRLFEEHSVHPSSIDFVIFCSLELDYYTPATSCIIQERLGIPETAGTLDINHGCSGFAYGLAIAKGLIESVECKSVLLLTSSTLTKTLHPKDRSSRFIFGDGAAATLITLRQGNKKGIGSFVMGTKGKDYKRIILEDGGARNPIKADSAKEMSDEFGNTWSKDTFFMDGTGVFLFMMNTIPKLVKNILEKNNTDMKDVDLFVFHQANAYTNEALRRKLGIPEEKFVVAIRDTGNTVSSTIPIALYQAISEGVAKPGHKILIAGFGTGMSWAGTLISL